MSQEYSFSLPYSAFDLDLIGLTAADVGSSEFTEKVSEFLAGQFATFGGLARIVCNDQSHTIDVRWTRNANFREPRDFALELLRSGKIGEAIPLLWTVHQQQPRDVSVLFNLGVAWSEHGQPDKAIPILRQLLEIEPHHVHGLVALGVALIRLQQAPEGEFLLRRALRLEPRNLWALRNLGGCLLQLGRAAEALPVLQTALEIGPQDPQTLLGMGQSLEALNRSDDADDYYQRIIRLGTPEPVVELAKERRSAIAAHRMRSAGELRPDVLMYLTGAVERFAGMSLDQIQALGIEIAILGQTGLDINDPEPKYTLRSLPGTFSGLHLCCLMYAAFKKFAPAQDVGIDFSREWMQVNGGR